MDAGRSYQVIRWHAREIARWGWRLARTLAPWRRAPNPRRDAVEALGSMAHSCGVIRAALKLRATGHLPW